MKFKVFQCNNYLYFRLQGCYALQSDNYVNDKGTVLTMASILFRYLKNNGEAHKCPPEIKRIPPPIR
jgi:hypothetical protein